MLGGRTHVARPGMNKVTSPAHLIIKLLNDVVFIDPFSRRNESSTHKKLKGGSREAIDIAAHGDISPLYKARLIHQVQAL